MMVAGVDAGGGVCDDPCELYTFGVIFNFFLCYFLRFFRVCLI